VSCRSATYPCRTSRQHRAGHTLGPNWPTFLTFATPYPTAP